MKLYYFTALLVNCFKFINLLLYQVEEMVSANCIVNISEDSDFTLQNLPFGVFLSDAFDRGHPCSAIGEHVFDLWEAAQNGLFDQGIMKAHARQVFAHDTLNAFMSLGRECWRETRHVLQGLLASNNGSPLETDTRLRNKVLIPLRKVKMLLPMTVGDYTDFYSSKEHAMNVGTMFRGKDNALQPNWYDSS